MLLNVAHSMQAPQARRAQQEDVPDGMLSPILRCRVQTCLQGVEATIGGTDWPSHHLGLSMLDVCHKRYLHSVPFNHSTKDMVAFRRAVYALSLKLATSRAYWQSFQARCCRSVCALCRLHRMGVLPTKKSLAQVERLSTSSFCRRRLAVVMVRVRMAETMREAVTFVEQGHVRVGPQTVTDPAFLVTRDMEDFVTWVDTSKIKRKVMQYNDKLDDFDLLA